MSKKDLKEMAVKYEALKEKCDALETANKRSTAFSKMLSRDLQQSDLEKRSLATSLTALEKNGRNVEEMVELRKSHAASVASAHQLKIENLQLRSDYKAAQDFLKLYKGEYDSVKAELERAKADLQKTKHDLVEKTALLESERLCNKKAVQLVAKEAQKRESELSKARKALAKSGSVKKSVSDSATSTEPIATKFEKFTDTLGLDWGTSTETQTSFADDSFHPVRSAAQRYCQDILKAQKSLDDRLRIRPCWDPSDE